MQNKLIIALFMLLCWALVTVIVHQRGVLNTQNLELQKMKEIKEEKKEEVKMEFSESKIKEQMKLFPAPHGWILIFNNSLVYVPDEEHNWDLAKKGTKNG